MRKTLVLIDGHSLAYRMYFALENTRMKSSDNTPTWAVYGFFMALFNLLRDIQPDAMAISFDLGRITFRNEMYAEYKAHRESMPDEMRTQLGVLREGIDLLGIPVYALENYEADDVIGTLSRQAAEHDWHVLILTGDQDSFQLVEDDKVEILIPSRIPREGLKRYNRQAVFDKLGVYPEQVIDYKGLRGDTSDNIPGIPGVGEKTAVKLLTEHQTLEALYRQLDTLPANKLKEKLVTYQDQAFLSQKLATIDRNAPVEVCLDDCKLAIPDVEALKEYFARYGFRSFLQQMDTLLVRFHATTDVAVAGNGKSPSSAKVADDPELDFDFSNEASSVSSVAIHHHVVTSADVIPHQVVTDLLDLQAFVHQVEETGVLAIDLETTGLDVFDCQLVGFALATSSALTCEMRPTQNPLKLADYPKTIRALVLNADAAQDAPITTLYVPVGHQGLTQQLSPNVVLDALKPVLDNPSIIKIVHNAKFEINVLKTQGVDMDGLVFDTMIASYVQDADRRQGLKSLVFEKLGIMMREITELIGTGRKQISFADVLIADAAPYAAADAYVTLQLAKTFISEWTPDQQTLFYELEMPLAPVLAQVERTGVCLDKDYLASLSETLDTQIRTVEAKITEMAGGPFNLNSPKQVGDILFDKLGLKPPRKTKGKTAFSTDAKVLEFLVDEHPIVQKLLDYRQLFKLKSTYIDALPALIHPKTGRVHTSFNQTVTATGRLSSSNPNLQNIPIRSEIGRSIRQAFVTQERSGWSIISADYSQIELRLLAHFSEDPNLLEAFRSGEDVHQATASLVFGVPKDNVTKQMRYQAKTVNFGVIYGQSAHGLSQQLQIPRAEAQQFIDRYFRQYPSVRAFIEGVKEEARKTGRVKTIFNRVRNLSEGLNSSNRSVREFSERAAFNTPLQGSAADLMKAAMIRLAHKLEREQARARIILQVHDELVLEVPDDEADNVTAWIEWAMALDQPLNVPLDVDIHRGASWMET